MTPLPSLVYMHAHTCTFSRSSSSSLEQARGVPTGAAAANSPKQLGPPPRPLKTAAGSPAVVCMQLALVWLTGRDVSPRAAMWRPFGAATRSSLM